VPARPPTIEILRCPATGDSLAEDGTGALVTSKYFDAFLVRRPAGLDAATGTYFLGRAATPRSAMSRCLRDTAAPG
jgi:hypothetical protein